jgi:hypothetical protein
LPPPGKDARAPAENVIEDATGERRVALVGEECIHGLDNRDERGAARGLDGYGRSTQVEFVRATRREVILVVAEEQGIAVRLEVRDNSAICSRWLPILSSRYVFMLEPANTPTLPP